MIKLKHTSYAISRLTEAAALHPVNVCGGGYLLHDNYPLWSDGHDEHPDAGSLSNDRSIDRI